MIEQVDFISGATRLYAIVGDPIEQVRSPEMVTAELRARGLDAIMVPVHAPAAAFDAVMEGLKATANLDGIVLTVPFKGTAMRHVARLGQNAEVVGSINAMTRLPDSRWAGEIFDGDGCLAGLRAAGHDPVGRHVQLIGAGGAGSAIGVALAFARPALIRVADPDEGRARALAERIARVDPAIRVELGAPRLEGIDFVLNASPVGMLGDARNPLGTDAIPASVVVFDAIVKPEETPLIAAARRCGCRTVTGRRMMRGQIGRIVDFFTDPMTALGMERA